jgi:hypothetical protein
MKLRALPDEIARYKKAPASAGARCDALRHYQVLNPTHVEFLTLTGLKRMASNAVPARQ